MALSAIWRRFTARRRKRVSFYETQHVMRKAVEAEAAARAPLSSPDKEAADKEAGKAQGHL